MTAAPLTAEQWGDRAQQLSIRAGVSLCHAWLTGPAGGLAGRMYTEILHPDGWIQEWATPAALPASFVSKPHIRNKLAGYRWERFGAVEPWPSPDDPAYSRPPWPYFRANFRIAADGSGRPLTVPLRELRGWFEDSTLYAEMIRTGGPAEQWSTHGFGHPATDGEWREARRALDLLQLIQRSPGGRPAGSRKGRVWNRRDYLDWYREAGQGYARDGERLTLRHLGAAMGVSGDTAS